jgi:serine/threonine-protein kinase
MDDVVRPDDPPVTLPEGRHRPGASLSEQATRIGPSSAVNVGSDSVPTGTVGRYPVSGEIGRGGMGAVLKGRDTDLGRDLAIKVLLQGNDNPDLQRRFVKEAQIGGQLQHPGIVPVYEMGKFDNCRPYFTMKLVQGRTLRELLAERPDPTHDLPHLLRIFQQVCETLGYAHSKGVIHRDLKPANIMVGAFGEVQVMDWGLAKVLNGERAVELNRAVLDPDPVVPSLKTVRSESTDSASLAGMVAGTPAYMAPEQANAQQHRVGRPSDVFGLGSMLCEIITGKPAYDSAPGDSAFQRAIRGDLADALARLDHCGADAELVRLARACLDPAPERRPPDAGAVADAVTAYLTGVQERLHAVEVERAEAQARAEAERWTRRLTIGLAASILLLVSVGGGGAAWLWYRHVTAETQRQQAEATLTRDVEALLARADKLRRNKKKLPEARAALNQARGRLGDEGHDNLRRQIEQVLGELDRVQQDQAMLRRLEEVRLAQAEVKDEQFDMQSADAAYAKAFHDYGIDVTTLPADEAAQRIKASAIREQLVAALDEWARVRSEGGNKNNGPLVALALAVDPDEWRRPLRQAWASKDWPKLKELAAQAKPADLSPVTITFLALALQQAGATDRSVAVLREGQAAHPGDFWLNHHLAYALHFMGGNLEEAIGFYRVSLALRPNSPGVCLNLAHALRLRGRLSEAEALLRKAIALKPDYAAAHNNLGIALQDQGKTAEGEKFLREAVRLDPKNVVAQNNLLGLLERQGRNVELLDAARAAVEQLPSSGEVRATLGVALTRLKRYLEAEDAFREAIHLDPRRGWTHLNYGKLMLMTARPREAEDEYRLAMRLGGPVAEARTALGALFDSQGRIKDAEAEFREAIRANPHYGLAHQNLASILVRQNRLDEAETEVREAMRHMPGQASVHVQLGLLRAAQGKPAEAEDAFREAYRLDPDMQAARENLVGILMRRKKLADAETVLRDIIRRNPADDAAHVTLSVVLAQQDKGDQAVAELREHVRARPSAEGHRSLGNLYLGLGRPTEALDAYREAIRLNPGFALAWYEIGIVYRKLGKTADAISAYREAIRLNGDFAEPHCNLAQLLRDQGKYEEALPLLRRGHALGSKRADWPYPSAQWLRSLELEVKLQAVLAGKQKPDDGTEWAELALVCYHQKRYATCARLYTEAFTRKPAVQFDARTGGGLVSSRAAVRAAMGEGIDAAKLDDTERGKLREQAVGWLRVHLDAWSGKLMAGKDKFRNDLKRMLEELKTDSALAGVRDAAALAKVPEAERDTWTKLWADVDALMKRAENGGPD